MAILQKAEEAFDEYVRMFPGLLAALLYTDMDIAFAEFIGKHWSTPDGISGQELLILVPEVFHQG